jgi:hypothetical protein
LGRSVVPTTTPGYIALRGLIRRSSHHQPTKPQVTPYAQHRADRSSRSLHHKPRYENAVTSDLHPLDSISDQILRRLDFCFWRSGQSDKCNSEPRYLTAIRGVTAPEPRIHRPPGRCRCHSRTATPQGCRCPCEVRCLCLPVNTGSRVCTHPDQAVPVGGGDFS